MPVSAIKRIFIIVPILLMAGLYPARSQGADVLDPIGKYISMGDAESLSAWFDDNLDISIFARGGVSSRLQAKQILKTFFRNFPPESFQIHHTAERANLKYVLANLKAGGESFHFILFLNCKSGTYRVQQIKIDRVVE